MGPEQGLTQPGMTIVCGDSHTATHGAFGALAFGIGTSQVGQVLATQCLLQQPSKSYAIRVEGKLQPGVTAKDIILAVIAKIGIGGGTECVFEYTGSTIRCSLDGRAHDHLQHVHRRRRARRSDRARRDYLPVHRRARLCAQRKRVGRRASPLAATPHRRRRNLRERTNARRQHAGTHGHLRHQPRHGHPHLRPDPRPRQHLRPHRKIRPHQSPKVHGPQTRRPA